VLGWRRPTDLTRHDVLKTANGLSRAKFGGPDFDLLIIAIIFEVEAWLRRTREQRQFLRLAKLARVLVRLDQVAGDVINVNHSVVSTAAKRRIVDCVTTGCVWLAMP
jgi:hypothetical protein